MNLQNSMPDWLNRSNCPAFTVTNHQITACNQAAEALLLSPGTDVRTLLLTGKEEYEMFQSGCLYLQLALSTRGYGAAVTREGDTDLFLLEQDPEETELRSLSLAARELRNPLSNLMIAADGLARQTDENPAVQELLARLNRSLHQMHRLVNNMSDAARSDLLTSTGMHDWTRLMYDIFEKIQTQLSGTRVTLSYEGPSEPIYGFANEGQLERAVLNIVSNAMKFMPEGGQIQAKLTKKQNLLHLSILDSGSGIPESILGTIFNRYQRQPGIEDSRYGIGLGMVLIRSAAADHGGTVLIDCPEGRGTRITMTMVIRKDSDSLKTPIIPPVIDGSRKVLLELSDCLPWEFYKQK